MAKIANVSLTFNDSVQVTIREDNTWSAPGDPHQVLTEDNGTWKYTGHVGTELIGATTVQAVLIGWRLSTAYEGENGDAFRFPQDTNENGKFLVDQIA